MGQLSRKHIEYLLSLGMALPSEWEERASYTLPKNPRKRAVSPTRPRTRPTRSRTRPTRPPRKKPAPRRQVPAKPPGDVPPRPVPVPTVSPSAAPKQVQDKQSIFDNPGFWIVAFPVIVILIWLAVKIL